MYSSLWGNPSQSYGASPAIWDHTVLPATRRKWTRPGLTPASKLVLDLPTPEGWKAEFTQGTRQCTGREPNSRSLDHKSDAITITPPTTRPPNAATYGTIISWKFNWNLNFYWIFGREKILWDFISLWAVGVGDRGRGHLLPKIRENIFRSNIM